MFNDNRFSDYFYIKQQFNGKNFSINIENYSVDENGTKNFLDNSYISYVNGNTIYSIGNKTLWWSPSNDNSLVISNNPRTPFGLYIQNKNSIKFNRKIINKLGSLDYAFFIRKLESSAGIFLMQNCLDYAFPFIQQIILIFLYFEQHSGEEKIDHKMPILSLIC